MSKLTVVLAKGAAILLILVVSSPAFAAGILPGGAGDGMAREYIARMTSPRPLPETRDEWLPRQSLLPKHILTCIGLNPFPFTDERPGDRLPLDVHFGGKLDYPTFSLSRIYWQTWQDVYASGYLYVPKNPGIKPAILCPHGHWRDGAKHPVVQSRCISLAMAGYVVLSVDSVHVRDCRIGLNPIGVMTWNNMRALDYLLSRPDVDPKKIGCVGASGGGQQTFYLMAVEPRIAVAAPVAIISYFRDIMTPELVHCYCNHVPFLLRYADEPEIAALFAPKPALFITETGDWTAKFPVEGYPEIQRVYSFFDAAEKVKNLHFQIGHDFNKEMRETVYAWFNKWLKGIDDPELAREPSDLPVETVEKLRSLDDPPPNAKGFETVPAEFLSRLAPDLPQLNDKSPPSEWRSFSRKLRKDLRSLTGEDDVVDGPLTDRLLNTRDLGERSSSQVSLLSEQEIHLPGVLLVPHPPDRKRPAIIILHEKGKDEILAGEKELVDALLQAGFTVLAIDTRYVGELDFGGTWRELYGVIFGRSEVSLAAHDIRRALSFLCLLDEVDPARIACLAFGDRAIPAIVAAALDDRIKALAVTDLGETYRSGRTAPSFIGVLTAGDIPQFAAAIAPRPLSLQGIARPAEFEFLRGAYSALDCPEKLRMRPGRDSMGLQELVSWLRLSVFDDSASARSRR